MSRAVALRLMSENPITQKRCSKCGEVKPLADFHRHNQQPDGRYPSCAACLNARRRALYAADGGMACEKSKWRQRKWRRGIGKTEIRDLLAKQGAVCAICGVGITDSAHIDHDHDTASVRGLLCAPCNIGLGMFRDDRQRLLAAVEYLERTDALRP